MKCETSADYSEEDFRRITCVKHSTFEAIPEILNGAYKEKHAKGGRSSSLKPGNMLSAGLEYRRE